MRTRGWPSVLLVLAPLATAACPAHYQVHGALPGDPATPTMRAERITLKDLHLRPDELRRPNDTVARGAVTREGLMTEEISSEIDRTLLLSVRVAADPPVEVLDMVWSPAFAPRCAGGHPALAILTDAEGELNSSLAERAQVRWERPVVLRGEQVLSGRFDEDPPLLRTASVVDVRLVRHEAGAAREECVRIPMTGPGITFGN